MITNLILNLLWCLKSVKLDNEVISTESKCSTINLWSFFHQNKLLLLKCYDKKMVKLPGCSSIGTLVFRSNNCDYILLDIHISHHLAHGQFTLGYKLTLND